mmetsp:Transcript_98008/g.218551  ORF Transcript_98008/g.218551 Transcript_98008/m.218551 type:complete len:389 (+) Transcript_98008:319-1485(+)
MPPGEALEAPDDGTLGWLVPRLSHPDVVNLTSGSVLGAGEANADVGSGDVPVVHRCDLQAELEAVAPQHLHIGQQLEGALDVLGDSVRHQFKDTVRGDEGDLAFQVELRKAHALVEPVVIERDALVRHLGTLLARHDQLVVHAKLALRHPGKVAPHNDLARYISPQALSLGRHHDVDVFDNVDIHLVLGMLDALGTPRAEASSLYCDLLELLLIVEIHGPRSTLCNVFLQDVRFQDLRVAIIDDLVQQLVDQHKVAADLVLVKGTAEVRLEDLGHLVEQLKNQDDIDIVLRGRADHYVTLYGVDEVATIDTLHWLVARVLRCDDARTEELPLRPRDIVLVGAPDEDLALQVDQQDRGNHPNALASSFSATAPLAYILSDSKTAIATKT